LLSAFFSNNHWNFILLFLEKKLIIHVVGFLILENGIFFLEQLLRRNADTC